jgi:uncharacterized Zn ribbon protein
MPRCRRCADSFERSEARQVHCPRCVREVDEILRSQERRAERMTTGPAWLQHAGKDLTGHIRRVA